MATSSARSRCPGQPSGLGWLPDGTLLVVSMTDRRVLRFEHDRLVVHAELGDIATFHCNDMVVDADGRAYVGNFGFDLHQAENTGDWSITAPGDAWRWSIATARSRRRPTDLSFPNGTVITPDGATLIVAESMGRQLTAFDRAADGTLSNRRVWADLGDRLPDGICLDAEGAVWVAERRRARVPARGRGRSGARGDRHRRSVLRVHAGRATGQRRCSC